MDSQQSTSGSFASQLAQSISSSNSSDSNSSASSFTSSANSNGSFGSSSFGNATSNSTGMTAVSNPFFIGKLAPSDQDRLRDAFNRY